MRAAGRLRLGSRPTATVASWVEAAQARSPVAFLRLNETAGATAKDTSRNGKDFTHTATPALGQAGSTVLEDAGVSYTAASSQRTSLNDAIFNAFSTIGTLPGLWAIAVVVKFPVGAPATAGYAVSVGANAANPIIGILMNTTGYLGSAYRDNAGSLVTPGASSGATHADNAFHLVTLECDGTTITLSIDNVVPAGGTAAAPSGAATTFDRASLANLHRNDEVNFATCVIDEAVFFPAALGSSGRAALYNAWQSETFQTFDGAGATFRSFKGDGSDTARPEGHPDTWGGNAVVLTGAEEDAVYALVHGTVGLERIRDNEPTTSALTGITAPNTYNVENPNDDADPNNYNAAGFDFRGPRNRDQARYAIKARAAGVRRVWWAPIVREAWMTAADFASATPPAASVAEYAEWMLAIMRDRAAAGAPVDCFAVCNEPDYTRFISSGVLRMSGEFMRDLIKNLCPRLAAEGFGTSVVLGPFNNSTGGAPRVDTVMADATARSYVVAIAIHGYDEASTNIANLKYRAEKWNLPLWEAELSRATTDSMGNQTASDIGYAACVQELLTAYNCAALDFQMGPYGQQEVNALVSLNYTGSTYNGATIKNTLAYYFVQFSKYIRRGHQRVRVTTSDPNVKVSAWRRPADGQVVIVAVNPTGGSLTPTITCSKLAGKTTAAVTRSSGTESNAAQAAQAIAANAFAPVLPATSISTFVA